MCVLGVTAYLNHEKMAEMEQTLAQMKGTRYVTEAQTADTGAEDTERMPSVAVETVMGNVENRKLSAGSGRNAGRCYSTAGGDGAGSAGDSRASGKCNGKMQQQELQRDRKLRGIRRQPVDRHAQTQRARRWSRQTQSTASTDGSLAAQTQGTTTAAGNASVENTQEHGSTDRGADVSVTGILRCAEGRQPCGNLPENISDNGNAGQALRGQRH